MGSSPISLLSLSGQRSQLGVWYQRKMRKKKAILILFHSLSLHLKPCPSHILPHVTNGSVFQRAIHTRPQRQLSSSKDVSEKE